MKSIYGPIVLILVASLALAACGDHGEAEAASSSDVELDFPGYEDMTKVDGAEIAADQLGFEADDGLAVLHVSDDEPMVVAGYYAMSVGDDCTQIGGGANQYVRFATLANSSNRVVVVTMTPGAALDLPAADIDGDLFGPFADSVSDLSDNKVIVYTRMGTCDAADVHDCVWAVQEQMSDDVQIGG